MLPTIPSLMASICSNAGVQCEKGRPNFDGSSHARANMAAICSSVNFGGPPVLCPSDSMDCMALRNFSGEPDSIVANSTWASMYLSCHFFTVLCSIPMSFAMALLLMPWADFSTIVALVFRWSGTCVPLNHSCSNFSCLSLNSIFLARAQGIFFLLAFISYYTTLLSTSSSFYPLINCARRH